MPDLVKQEVAQELICSQIPKSQYGTFIVHPFSTRANVPKSHVIKVLHEIYIRIQKLIWYFIPEPSLSEETKQYQGGVSPHWEKCCKFND